MTNFIEMNFKKITETDSNHNHLELKSTEELVEIINDEDITVASSVRTGIVFTLTLESIQWSHER